MKERPILFSGPMVQAILDGRKSQTRRVVKIPAWVEDLDPFRVIEFPNGFYFEAEDESMGLKLGCPYGKPGDRLWVRETWGVVNGLNKVKPSNLPSNIPVIYRAESVHPNDPSMMWRPSIFMPRWASRILLEVVSVRVERVQDISEEDAKAEGVHIGQRAVLDGDYKCRHCGEGRGRHIGRALGCFGGMGTSFDPSSFRGGFKWLWDSINKERGFGWDKNPWVWVVEFKRI